MKYHVVVREWILIALADTWTHIQLPIQKETSKIKLRNVVMNWIIVAQDQFL